MAVRKPPKLEAGVRFPSSAPLMKKTIELSKEQILSISGILNSNLSIISDFFPNLKISTRGTKIIVSGPEKNVKEFLQKLQVLLEVINSNNFLSEQQLLMILSSKDLRVDLPVYTTTEKKNIIFYCYDGTPVTAKTPNQQKIVESIENNDLVIVVGPAGTGKTYTAVALALKYLKEGKVKRIVLTRPAVEAGESLGFLPGSVKEKLDPYLRPLYDAIEEMLSPSKLQELLQKEIIQIVPIAFMRGRTLNNSFIILDEAQNATVPQMKMTLTRLGHNSKLIVTGDITQSDLPQGIPVGLKKTIEVLNGIENIDFIFLDERDVVRHPLVVKIIKAFEEKK